jgi:hypothetical protein
VRLLVLCHPPLLCNVMARILYLPTVSAKALVRHKHPSLLQELEMELMLVFALSRFHAGTSIRVAYSAVGGVGLAYENTVYFW